MYRFIREFKDGVNAYFDAVAIIREHRLWIYLMIPGLISLVFGAAVAYGAYVFSGEAASTVSAWYPWEVGAKVISRIAGFLGAILIWAGALLAYKYVVLILVAPFMSPLSERVEGIITGRTMGQQGFGLLRALREIWRGIRIALRNIIRELLLSLLVVIVTGILPFLAVFSGPAVFFLQAYYAGFGNMDFTLERHLGVRSSIRFVRGYKGLAVGNGIIFLLLLMIPVIGLFLAPGLSTVAGTIRTIERLPEH